MGSTSDFDFDGCISHGPWGDLEGNKWVYLPRRFVKKMKIIVRHGAFINSISFQTNCGKGEAQTSTFGVKGGSTTNTICIDYPDEYLMSISMTTGLGDGSWVLSSICFTTNLNFYGPYGIETQSFSSYDVKGGVVVGFHGRVSRYLTAIGVYVKPESVAFGPISTYEHKIMPELCFSISRDAGPWGASGGKPWDDGVFSTIKQVFVHVGELNVIYAIQFEYMKSDAMSTLSKIHGGTDSIEMHQVSLDDKDEYLTGISGFYGPVKGYDGLEAIASITFHSNKMIYGPYGEERGAGYVYFSSTPSSGKVVGFHGRNNGFLSAIGVHKEYF